MEQPHRESFVGVGDTRAVLFAKYNRLASYMQMHAVRGSRPTHSAYYIDARGGSWSREVPSCPARRLAVVRPSRLTSPPPAPRPPLRTAVHAATKTIYATTAALAAADTLRDARRLFGPNRAKTVKKKQDVVRQNSGQGAARGAPAPHTPHASGAHPHVSGTALEHTLREHPGRQHAVWCYAREASGPPGCGARLGGTDPLKL